MAEVETKSILTTTKLMLGIQPEASYFDDQLIVAINSAFSVLNQLGVGPEEGFFITGCDETWDDYSTDTNMKMVQMYVAVKAHILWDPPTNSTLLQALQDQAKEYEFRLNVHCDRKKEADE